MLTSRGAAARRDFYNDSLSAICVEALCFQQTLARNASTLLLSGVNRNIYVLEGLRFSSLILWYLRW